MVELSKFGKRKPSSLIDLREEWCYLLKESRRMGEKKGKELSRKGYEMEEAMFHLKELSREEGLRLVEEAREKAWKDQMAREDDSFGRGVAKRQQDLVINMLKNKLEISLISKIMGLSAVEINKLKESLS